MVFPVYVNVDKKKPPYKNGGFVNWYHVIYLLYLPNLFKAVIIAVSPTP